MQDVDRSAYEHFKPEGEGAKMLKEAGINVYGHFIPSLRGLTSKWIWNPVVYTLNLAVLSIHLTHMNFTGTTCALSNIKIYVYLILNFEILFFLQEVQARKNPIPGFNWRHLVKSST